MFIGDKKDFVVRTVEFWFVRRFFSWNYNRFFFGGEAALRVLFFSRFRFGGYDGSRGRSSLRARRIRFRSWSEGRVRRAVFR